MKRKILYKNEDFKYFFNDGDDYLFLIKNTNIAKGRIICSKCLNGDTFFYEYGNITKKKCAYCKNKYIKKNINI